MEKLVTSYLGLGNIILSNNIRNMTILRKKLFYALMIFLLTVSMCSCKSKSMPENYVYVLENGDVFDSQNKKVATLLDYNTEIPIITMPSRQGYIYVSSSLEDEFWDKYEVCFVDITFNTIKKINIVDYLQTSYYSELQSKEQGCLIPNILTVQGNKVFFAALIDESQKGVFLIDLQKEDSKLLFVDYISGQNIAISEDGEDIFFSQKQDKEYTIMKYNIPSEESTIYKNNASDIAFSPNYEYEIYVETNNYNTQIGEKGIKHNYSQNLVVRDIHSKMEVYRENECALYEYEFSFDSKGIICKETSSRHLMTQYENRTRCTYIDILSGNTSKIYQSDWGNQINQLLIQ